MQIKNILTIGVVSSAIFASSIAMATPAHHKPNRPHCGPKCVKMHKKIAIAKYKKHHGG